MSIPEAFKIVADEVIKSSKTKSLSVKQFLYLFGCEKRTTGNCGWIDGILKQFEILVEPNYKSVYIHSTITISAIPKVKMHNKQKVKDQPDELEIYDPTPKLRILSAANIKPVSINKDAEIRQAMTLMLINDYSQLPVMSTERKVDGIISWKTLGRVKLSNDKEELVVQDCMDRDVTILDYDMPLLDAVNTVLQKEVVLVKKNDGVISGIITSVDVGSKFVSMSEPFLILEQIENHIRSILDGNWARWLGKNFFA